MNKMGINFVISLNKRYASKKWSEVIQDIRNNNSVFEKCKPFIRPFIKWAALERMDYKPDIVDELACYLKRKRAYYYDSEKWNELRLFIFKRDGFCCQYCGIKNTKFEVDHIIPVSKGGSDDHENLTTACFTCNRSKRNKSAEEFKKTISN